MKKKEPLLIKASLVTRSVTSTTVKVVAISFKGIPEVVNFSVDTCEEAANSFEGTFGVKIFSDDIFGRFVYNSEGISGVEYCDVDNEL